MNNILDTIFAFKKKEVEALKLGTSIKKLEASPLFDRETISLKSRLQKHHIRPNIITEFKRKSPSKGFINEHALPHVVTLGYEANGAVGISILTDTHFFGGGCSDFLAGREATTKTPLLRKEFIVDEFQVIESKSIGADVVLLIAAMLTPSDITYLSRAAKMLNLEVLLEIHTKEEIETTPLDFIDIIGVNNRNLKTFAVSLETSFFLSEYIPPTFVKISESGVYNARDIVTLQTYGYDGFLIGEMFMKHSQPDHALRSLMEHFG